MDKSNIKVLFFGTPEFAVPALETLVKEGYAIVAVITEPDKPIGREQVLTPTPIKIAAQKYGLKKFQPKNKFEIRNLKLEIADSADIGVIAAYGRIIPNEIINLPKHGTLAIHPSLLPKYRGPSPIQTAILNGDKETGVTIIKVDEELDHGDIVAIENFRISEDIPQTEVHSQLFRLGSQLLTKILPGYLAGKIELIPQEHARATFTKKFKLEDGLIKPEDTVGIAYNKIRALNPEPGTYWLLPDGKKLKILNTSPNLDIQMSKLGLYASDDRLVLALADGELILEEVQLEGKNKMSGKDFINGYKHILKLAQ